MKKFIKYALVVVIVAIVLDIVYTSFVNGCNENNSANQKINDLEERVELQNDSLNELNCKISTISDLRDSLLVEYNNTLEKQKNVRTGIKIRYIAALDTNSKDTIECLPKIYVDSLILSQDSINKVASKRFELNDEMIAKLLESNNIKENIINNKNEIITEKDTKIKKLKRSRFKNLIIGIVSGFGAGRLLH